MADMKAIAENLIKGKKDEVANLVKQALDEGIDPATVLNEGLLAGMAVVGERFKKNEIYIPEVLIAARAMHAGMDVLQPLLAAANVQAKGKVVMGTVQGDLHDIGKNLVIMMLKGGGYEVEDLGIDVPAEKFVEKVQENKPDVLALSALLTTTMPQMKTVIEELEKAGLRDEVKVIIGGAPVTQEFADEIGADGYGPDAASAVDVVNSLVGA